MRIMTAIMMTANGAAGAVLGVAGEAAFSRLPALLGDLLTFCFSQRERESTTSIFPSFQKTDRPQGREPWRGARTVYLDPRV